MRTFEQIQAEIAKLQEEANAVRQAERAKGIAQIREIMSKVGLTLSDIGSAGQRHHALKGVKAKPLYRHPDTGETWTGRGKIPNWMRKEVEKGSQKESFRIS